MNWLDLTQVFSHAFVAFSSFVHFYNASLCPMKVSRFMGSRSHLCFVFCVCVNVVSVCSWLSSRAISYSCGSFATLYYVRYPVLCCQILNFCLLTHSPWLLQCLGFLGFLLSPPRGFVVVAAHFVPALQRLRALSEPCIVVFRHCFGIVQ